MTELQDRIPASPAASPRITDEHIEHLRREGYVLVEDFLTPAELQACRANLGFYFPSPEKYTTAPERYARLPRYIEFPYTGDALNHVSTHPEIISFLERLLGTTELELGESLLQAKYGAGGGDNNPDEQMHCDAWGPNQLVYPRDDGAFRQVPTILYYSDVTEDLGPTYVVSQQRTRGRFLLPDHPAGAGPIRRVTHPREDYGELYATEQPVLARAGSLLVMSMRTFHRGSPITKATGARFVHFLTYHATSAHWMRSQNWRPAAPYTDTPELHRFMTRASPRQRELLGVPPPGHTYWNEETVAGVAARYPELDTTPYRDALLARGTAT